MIREEDGTVYHTNGHSTAHTASYTRIKKKSEEIAKLKHKITMLKLQVRNTYGHFTDAQLASKKAELATMQRRLEDMESRSIQHRVKKTYKKLAPAKIKAYVLSEIEKAKANGMNWITAEDIAYALQVKVHCVKQVLQQLNIEGVLHQPTHQAPHDSPRDPYGYGNRNAWLSDTYSFRNSEESENN